MLGSLGYNLSLIPSRLKKYFINKITVLMFNTYTNIYITALFFLFT